MGKEEKSYNLTAEEVASITHNMVTLLLNSKDQTLAPESIMKVFGSLIGSYLITQKVFGSSITADNLMELIGKYVNIYIDSNKIRIDEIMGLANQIKFESKVELEDSKPLPPLDNQTKNELSRILGIDMK